MYCSVCMCVIVFAFACVCFRVLYWYVTREEEGQIGLEGRLCTVLCMLYTVLCMSRRYERRGMRRVTTFISVYVKKIRR